MTKKEEEKTKDETLSLDDPEVKKYIKIFKNVNPKYLLDALKNDLDVEYYLYVRNLLDEKKISFININYYEYGDLFLIYLGSVCNIHKYNIVSRVGDEYFHFDVRYDEDDGTLSYGLYGDSTIISKSTRRTVVSEKDMNIDFGLFYEESKVKLGNEEITKKMFTFEQTNGERTRSVQMKYDVSNQQDSNIALPYLNYKQPEFIEYHAAYPLISARAVYKHTSNDDYQIVKVRPFIFKRKFSKQSFVDDCFESFGFQKGIPEFLINTYKKDPAVDIFRDVIQDTLKRTK